MGQFRTTILAIFCLGIFAHMGYSASTTGLADWCFNQNGNINTCNGGTITTVSGFDTTLEPGTNNLGTASFTLSAGQYAAAYMDYDLDFVAHGSFADYGSVHGAPGSFKYELDDPNTSNIFTDFSGNNLSNANNVGTFALPPNDCCDVTWALSYTATQAGTLVFTVSNSNPGGFYLQQTNGIAGDSIYLSAVFTPNGGGPPPVPEPATVLLVVPAGLALWAWKRRTAAPVTK